MRIHIWPTEHWVDDEAWAAINDVAATAEHDMRTHLPTLERDFLFAQSVDEHWQHWKFDHPDGRRNIAYRVGTWIADRATASTGRTAAELVWEAPADVLRAAGI